MRKIFERNSEISSVIIDRAKGGVFSFARGKFRWNNFSDPEDLLGMIIASEKLDYEPDVSGLVSMILEPGDIVFDIGANFGWHSIHFAKLVFPNGRVYCFEPVPETYRELSENIILNFSTKSHVIAEQLALGDKEEESHIFIPKKLGSAFATLFPASVDKQFSKFIKIKINLTTIDNYVEKHNIPRINFIKCDAEGAEFKIINGGQKTLHNFSPMILLEVNDRNDRDIFLKLKTMDYSAFYFQNHHLKELKNTEKKLPDFNFLFVKKNSVEVLRKRIKCE